MDKQIVLDKIKTARLQRMLNNCYSMNVVDHVTNVWDQGDEFIISYNDHGVQRLAFFANGWKRVDDLLSMIEEGNYYLEYMTKDPDEYVPISSSLTARMKRMANPDCRTVFSSDSPVLRYKDSSIGIKAEAEDAFEINSILWKTFRPEISHLLTDDEIRQIVDQFIIHKTDKTIDALLQAEIMPRKFYINQIVNMGEKKTIHAMLLNKLEEYTEAGGKYLFAWIDETNIPSLKFHAKYGLEHDGMWSIIYNLVR